MSTVGVSKSWVRSGYVVTVRAVGKPTRRFLVWGTNHKNAQLRFSIASVKFGYASGSLKSGQVEAKFNPLAILDTDKITEVA